MKRADLLFITCILLLLLPFFISDPVLDAYKQFNANHGYIMAFFKFAILATLGEVIGLRIRNGVYNQPGFGILPRAITWGFLGLSIKMAFVIFGAGAPIMLQGLGIEIPAGILKHGIMETQSWIHLLTAFAVSATMNTFFAPVFMTFHKITDEHILSNGGTLKGFFSPFRIGHHMANLNWSVMWNFVFKKTIPFFWIPAHTITFLLPPEYRILAAAVLGVVLGVFMALASLKSVEAKPVGLH